MPFVLDCSVAMAWLFLDEGNDSTDALREKLVTEHAVVPALWLIEVGNALLAATRRGRLSEEDWPRIRNDLAELPIEIDTDSCARVLDRVLPVARDHKLSVYDATYLELAMRLSLPLATLDRQLAAAARGAGIEIL